MKKCLYFLIFSILSILVIAKPGTEYDAGRLRKTVATYISDGKITVNGELQEPVWQTGIWQGNLIQRNPNDGTPETYSTEFCVLYDNEYLYIGARARDPEPDKITAILTRRDEYTESDWMYVSIDSYNDNRTAFEFGLNAAGVKHDIRRYDDESMDESWDAIWDGEAEINSDGWSAEWRIPFRELRFTSTEQMQWGLQFYRELPRHENELSVWSYWAQSEEGFVSHYGNLSGLNNVKSQRPLYVAPYFAGSNKVSDNLVSDVHPEKYDILSNVGGDVRYSSPNGLTLNATINPDFGQVESDPADYNLTEFETYFSEKRPFFMEGSNIFNFALGFGDGDNSSNTLFYSRRIGRAPQGSANTDDSKDLVDIQQPEITNIISAAKLTGKTANGLSMGVLEAVTAEEHTTVYYGDESKDKQVVEPLTNYHLTRVQQDFNEGQTSVGGIFTSVNRRLDDTNMDFLHSQAYTGGIDIDHEFLDRKYGFLGAVSFSHVRGDTLAIQQTQLSSARYFHREEAPHIEYDPERTSLSGFAVKAIGTKNTGHLRAAGGVVAYSPGFEINDMGFLNSVDNINQFAWAQYFQWEPKKIFRSYRINFNQWTNYDFSGLRKVLGGNINANGTFNNSWSMGGGINHNWEGMNVSFNRGGPPIYVAPSTNGWLWVNTDSRKNLIFYTYGQRYVSVDNVKSFYIEEDVTWRPRHNLQLEAEISYNQLDDTWSWIGRATDNDGNTHYIWSDMLQQTLALEFRADLTLTNNLSVQFYGQPYFTAGDFFNLKEVIDADNPDINERFDPLNEEDWDLQQDDDGVYRYYIDRVDEDDTPYKLSGYKNFNYKQFRSNLVVRWEYATGSALYLVWSQGYTNYELFKEFDVQKDLNTLFKDIGTNVFMVKLSHTFNI
ncbi:MAG: DUF5916 domain-containing protein [Candidatus Neomarinimicrobiota bacterium]